MSYIYIESSKNTVNVLKGEFINNEHSALNENELIGSDYSIISNQEKFIGFKIKNFLSAKQLKGAVAEHEFKELLNRNKIPFLYVGQGPIGVEYSSALKKITKSKRPDFLVFFDNYNNILFDVKCRHKIGFPNSNLNYFHLFKSEIFALYNLQQQLRMPVWLAFFDDQNIKHNKAIVPCFYFLPINTLHAFVKLLEKKLSYYYFNQLQCIRIPNQFLVEVKDVFVLNTIVNSIDSNITNDFADLNMDLIKHLQQMVINIIKTKQTYKSTIYDQLKSLTNNVAFKDELHAVLEHLISENAISYRKNKPLAMVLKQQ